MPARYTPNHILNRPVAILWSYVVEPSNAAAFERAYGPQGEWCALFERSASYLGTELFRDADGAYVTIDRWTSAAAYEAFLEEHAAEYRRIDALCETLTKSERLVGRFSPVSMRPSVALRNVEEDDLPIFFRHQDDPDAARMAAFPRRDHEAFMTHWRTKVLANPENMTRAVIVDGRVAGNVVAWTGDGRRFVGYWLGQEHWGRGVATRAVAAFLEQERTRPLFAWVAETNRASIRVLEKSGFALARPGDEAHVGADGVRERLFVLT
jgi:RimJ/RimL family protein N-acetyltransferase